MRFSDGALLLEQPIYESFQVLKIKKFLQNIVEIAASVEQKNIVLNLLRQLVVQAT